MTIDQRFYDPRPGTVSLGNGGGFGGGAPGGATIYDTLTPQQHSFADLMGGNISRFTGSSPMYPGQGSDTGNALQNALTANPAGSLSPEATAQYINKSVAIPLLRQYDTTIMPRLNDAYAAVGALMGSRRGFAQQQALTNIQNTIGAELGKAQLANQHLSAQLQEQRAQRQGQVVNQQQQLALGYNQLAGQLTGQPWMAIQPNGGGGGGGFFGGGGGVPSNFGGFDGGSMFTGTSPANFLSDSNTWGPGYDNLPPGPVMGGTVPTGSEDVGDNYLYWE